MSTEGLWDGGKTIEEGGDGVAHRHNKHRPHIPLHPHGRPALVWGAALVIALLLQSSTLNAPVPDTPPLNLEWRDDGIGLLVDMVDHAAEWLGPGFGLRGVDEVDGLRPGGVGEDGGCEVAWVG